jgi:hypothetical protein
VSSKLVIAGHECQVCLSCVRANRFASRDAPRLGRSADSTTPRERVCGRVCRNGLAQLADWLSRVHLLSALSRPSTSTRCTAAVPGHGKRVVSAINYPFQRTFWNDLAYEKDRQQSTLSTLTHIPCEGEQKGASTRISGTAQNASCLKRNRPPIALIHYPALAPVAIRRNIRGLNDAASSDRSSASDRITASVAGDLPGPSVVRYRQPREKRRV